MFVFCYKKFLLYRTFSSPLAQGKYGMEQFCGYVQVRAGYEFLRSQKDISYRTLVLDEDVHARYKDEKLDMDFLRAFERGEYGTPTLWPYLSIDRIIMFQQLVREYPWNTPKYTHEEMLRILQVNIKAVLSFLETEKPDVIVLSVVFIAQYAPHENRGEEGYQNALYSRHFTQRNIASLVKHSIGST